MPIAQEHIKDGLDIETPTLESLVWEAGGYKVTIVITNKRRERVEVLGGDARSATSRASFVFITH